MFKDIDKLVATEMIKVLLHHSNTIQVDSATVAHTCLDLFLVIPDLILPYPYPILRRH
jgi:hypothetical protein